MFDDDSRPPFNRPAAHLLNELESIKGTLTEGLDAENDLAAEIPLLDDMVIRHLDDNAALLGNNKLLDIQQIFAEDEAPSAEVIAPTEAPMPFPRFTLDVTISDDDDIAVEKPSAIPKPGAATELPTLKPRIRPDYSREVLIQELVDEFIPRIEAELHRRLQQLDDSALRRLQDPD